MKHASPRHPSVPAALGLAFTLAFAASSAHAASGTWNVDADGNWTGSANWLSGTIAGSTAGDVANFTLDLSANRTVTVDGSNKTIGVLNIGDTNNTHAYTLGTGSALYFNNGSSDAQINQVATSKGDTINVAIGIIGNGNLTISNASANTLTIGSYTQAGSSGAKTLTLDTSAGAIEYKGPIVNATGGTMAVVKNGSGLLKLTGTNGNSTYSGGFTLNAGTLEFGYSQTALGTGTFTINGGTINNGYGAARTNTNNNAQIWAANFTFGTSGQDLNLGTGTVSLTGNRTVTVSTAARTLTVGGAISGTPYSLTKAGAGILALGGTNDYTGGTFVSAGTLATLSTGGTFGAGNVTLNNTASKLTLGNASSIADSATLSFISTMATGSINLNFDGTELLAGIYKTNGTPSSIVAGLYTADELNTFFSTTIFTGTGSLQFGAVPEPSTYAAILGGIAFAGVILRRRR
jgi:fibronectin-binding autotransporter adhesin